MKKVLSIVLVALMGFTLLSGCGNSGEAKTSGNYLKVGVRKDLPNFSVYDEDADTYYGFEDDLAKYIAINMGYDGVEYVGLTAETRESSLNNGEVDVVVAAFSKTDEREENFDLSSPYYEDKGLVMIEKSTLFDSYANLKGMDVAFRKGATSEENLAEKLKADGLINEASVSALKNYLNVIEMDSYGDMETALENGDVDAVCADGCITISWLNDDRMYFDEPYSEEDYVAATKKGSELSDKVNSAIESLSDDGTIDALKEKWGV